MPKKKLEKKLDNKSETPLAEQGVTLQQTESPVFYRCTCPECGENTLELFGFDVFYRAEFLGVTDDGEFGCGDMDLKGDYHWQLACGSCGHTAFDTDELPTDTLLDWAAAHGEPIKQLEFTCPVCDSKWLEKVYRMTREVRAVYETVGTEKSEADAEVALSFEQAVWGRRAVRYCCIEGHELTKTDGSFVETDEELVEWLKAHQPSVKG